VTLIVKAWDDNSVNPHQMAEDVLQCLYVSADLGKPITNLRRCRFHPDFHNSQSKVQREMLQCVHEWVRSLGQRQHQLLGRLTKQAVRNHENIRMQGEGGHAAAEGTAAYTAGLQAQHDIQGYISQQAGRIPGVTQAQGIFNHFTPPAGPPPGMRRDLGSGAGERTDFPGMSVASPAQTPAFPGSSSSYHQSSYSGHESSYPSHETSYPGQETSYPGQGYQSPSGPPPPSGYAPAYNPSYGGPPEPSAPYPGYGGGGGGGVNMPDAGGFAGPGGFGAPGGFPSPHGHGGYGGFPSPPGPPQGGFPSPFAPPQGPPPQFPGASNQPPYHGY
jgi:hypothetical protein